MTSPPEVIVLCRDLFFASSIEGTARQHAVPCRVVDSLDQLAELCAGETVRQVIVDLEFPDLDPAAITAQVAKRSGPESSRPALSRPDPPHSAPSCPQTVAFGPHVQVARLKAARQAGFDHVLPRSEFSARLAAIVTGQL